MSLKPLDIIMYKSEKTDESLISPPLTPTDALSPVSASAATINHRKDFIHAYSKMAPYLRPNSRKISKVIQLDVYQQYYSTHCRKLKLIKRNTSLQEKATTTNKQKKKRVSNYLPTGKDAALVFDAIDIDSYDHDFYPAGWVPNKQALDKTPVKVSWKGAPLPIHSQPYITQLHSVEVTMASVLRLSPIQYLRCKRTLILASRTLKIQDIPFTKSIAQKLCRVDVNKTSALWNAFHQLGWFDGPI